MYKNIDYFKGLNALRFFAAYLVVLHHAEQIRLKNKLFHLKDLSLFNNGGLAVSFFFVLSGYLITYLLLREQRNFKGISIRKFYGRRVLRIWPLYFLLVAIGVFFIPFLIGLVGYAYEMPYAPKDVLVYFVFFSPFMVNILFGHHLLEPLWSIGVEEVFYLLWAPLFKFLKNQILPIILSVIALKYILVVAADAGQFPSTLARVINMLQFESMAVGGLGAYLIFNRKKKIESSILFSKPVQLVVILFIGARLFCDKFLTENSSFFLSVYHSGFWSNLLLSGSFAWLIIHISLNEKSLIGLNNRVLNFLGEISYGIYMYHMLVIFGIILILKNKLALMSDSSATILFYFLVTIGTILVSFVSKKLFEDYFLRLKAKFEPKPASHKTNLIRKG